MNKQMRKIIGLLALTLITVSTLGLGAQHVNAAPRIGTNAYASAIIDVQSGRILYSSNGDVETRIASLTKIMTAIVAIEHGQLDDKVKVSRRAAGKEGSSIYLKVGEEMTLSNLLYGLMLRSGNDAATAIAEHVGGSEAGFVYLMNKKAEELGLKHSQFRNPHGLDEEGHYSSANDLAVLTAYALKNKIFAEIVKTKFKQAPNPNEKWNYAWRNKNKMLNMFEGADGVKTGYTKKALRCLVSSATRNGQQLAVVTLNDGDDWRDHQSLLNWGFKHFPLSNLAEVKHQVPGSELVYGSSFRYPLEQDELEKVTADVTLVDVNSLRYTLGERGRMNFYLNGEHIGSVPLYEKDSPRIKLNEKRADEASFNQFMEQNHWHNKLSDKLKQWLQL